MRDASTAVGKSVSVIRETNSAPQRELFSSTDLADIRSHVAGVFDGVANREE